ncbi:hypothetical protein [Arthrobacter sp. ISL-28]|uniref:hypothetical protein n=1 Tax=Arthrobacter sp. ISL-28 TaxID=2819108 RepID=UPI001BEAAEDF|nr:hypothetical protein [Arthrobacter sp. ISL-28]MBT2522025.1 hypothetical protein [Arthrobacter sp. ISL-28]
MPSTVTFSVTTMPENGSADSRTTVQNSGADELGASFGATVERDTDNAGPESRARIFPATFPVYPFI